MMAAIRPTPVTNKGSARAGESPLALKGRKRYGNCQERRDICPVMRVLSAGRPYGGIDRRVVPRFGLGSEPGVIDKAHAKVHSSFPTPTSGVTPKRKMRNMETPVAVSLLAGPVGNFSRDQPIPPTSVYYQNADVLARFCVDYGGTQQGAERCFEELKNFLARAAAERSSIEPPSKEVDQMWHTFLLFTKDYAAFCERSFGKFVHHVPRTATYTGRVNCSAGPCGQCDGDS